MEKLNFNIEETECPLVASGITPDRAEFIYQQMMHKAKNADIINVLDMAEEFIYTFASNITQVVGITVAVSLFASRQEKDSHNKLRVMLELLDDVKNVQEEELSEVFDNFPVDDILIDYMENMADCDKCDKTGNCILQERYKKIKTHRKG